MKFVNLKTCDGVETFLYFRGGLLRLSLLPQTLRSLPKKELAEALAQLTTFKPHCRSRETPSRTLSLQELATK